MGFFDKLQKPGHTALKQEKYITRTEVRKDANGTTSPAFVHPIHSKPHKMPIKMLSKENGTQKNGTKRTSPTSKSSSEDRVRSSRKRASSTPQRQEWGNDDDMSDQDLKTSKKRARRNSTIDSDLKRCIRSRKAFSNEDGGKFGMVHAADIATIRRPKNYKPAFPSNPESTEVFLRYPSASQMEKFELVVPVQNDDFKTLDDIREVMETIISNYLPNDVAATLTNDNSGLLRRVKRAVERLAGSEYIDCIQEWNDILNEYRQDGTIENVINDWKTVNLKLLERILTQTYSRTVSLRVNDLRRYENGTDNVYGELLPTFISTILKKDTKIESGQVFVDLGSGVGNCVLQAALEVGCESWGCEMMERACDLAELQQKEFEARCRLWGLSMGEIHLERGDFLKNESIRKVLHRADLVLVNNQAFTPALNEDLINLFLDLKEGAKVVSLKSFVPMGQKSQSKNAGAIYNILDVVQKTYYSKCVSWTDAPGTYFISTKDSSRVQALA
ncbi:MAG: hypothetical protein Q9164_000297 [Protoblastenia rupestris]